MNKFVVKVLFLMVLAASEAAMSSEMHDDLEGAKNAVELATADILHRSVGAPLRVRKVTVERIIWTGSMIVAKEIYDDERGLIEGVEYWRVIFDVEGDESSGTPASFEVKRYFDVRTGSMVGR